jgi:hypothetical protein
MRKLAERGELWAVPSILGPLHQALTRLPRFPPQIMRLQTPNPVVPAQPRVAIPEPENLKM